jgi:hypothetical protein
VLQVKPQTPAEHVAVPLATAGHLFPQVLQFCGSDVSSTHAPVQKLWPPGQPDTHWGGPASAPASSAGTEQTGVPASAEHAEPHDPQLDDVLNTEQTPPQAV